MIVERIWTGNAYRNFNYLIACPETGEALAIDPLDHEKTLATAKVKGWQITQVLNTHEHHDHTGGNAAVIAGHRRQTDRPPQGRRAHCGRGPGREGRRRDQGRQDRRAGMPGHARPHDVPHLPALAHRAAGAVFG
ncbi:MBL fold metallo-hydrolase [Polaromonas sp. P1(28)-8]|nr:MBL fold metallo-hydrolase [Polaromonas sp. P1(28)-8]